MNEVSLKKLALFFRVFFRNVCSSSSQNEVVLFLVVRRPLLVVQGGTLSLKKGGFVVTRAETEMTDTQEAILT